MKAIVTCQMFCEKQKLDTILPFADQMPGWTWILFSDKPFNVNCTGTPWTVRHAKPFDPECGTVSAKHIKWCTRDYLPECEEVIWIDAFYSLYDSRYFDSLTERFCTFKHPDRNDVREELRILRACKRAPDADIRAAKQYVATLNLPKTTGLFWTVCVYRKFDAEIEALGKKVFEL